MGSAAGFSPWRRASLASKSKCSSMDLTSLSLPSRDICCLVARGKGLKKASAAELAVICGFNIK